MGSKVSINTLGIRVSQETSELPANQEEGRVYMHSSAQQKIMNFPCFLVAGQHGIEYKSETEMEKCEIPAVYKATLQNFATLCLERLSSAEKTKAWKILGEGENLQLQQGDLIKIGSIFQLRLRCLVTDPSSKTVIEEGIRCSPDESQWINNDSGAWRCRICFEQEDTAKNNPLVSLCKCEGSVKYIHYECLKRWVGSKVKEVEYLNYTMYQYMPFACDLCKQPIKAYFSQEGSFYSLLEKEPVSPPYAILETPSVSGKPIISFRIKLHQGASITFGRSADCSISLKMQAVSRSHCALFYTHKQLFLKDLSSKYGTSLYSPNAIYDFAAQKGINLQINSSIIQVAAWESFGLKMPELCAGTLKMRLRVVEDKEEKFTVETSGNIFDFLD